jgi:ankyrin repeat protein
VFGLLLFAAARHSAGRLDQALVAAVDRGDVDAVRSLLASGANPNARLSYENRVTSVADAVDWVMRSERIFWHNAPVLVEAADCRTQGVAISEALLRAGANVNGRDNYGRTALLAAARDGNADIVRLLLEHGADLTCRDKDGRTAAQAAVRNVQAVRAVFHEHGLR